ALFTTFDGILVFGEYALTAIVLAAYGLLHAHFYQLPYLIAIISCAFLGLTVSLPYLLFRKELGKPRALAMVAIGAFVPLPVADYAVIGTICNLKFVFIYWAVLFILYRHLHANSERRVIFADCIIFLCLL